MEPQPDLTFEESVKQVMQTLPPIIRDYLSQGRYTPVARNLMAKYGLRIDQGGVLEREIMLLLMGIENPDEFSKVLAEEAKLDQKTINGIVEDVNAQIFIPLREEEMKMPPPSAQPQKYFHLQNKIAPPRPMQAAHASPQTAQGTAKPMESAKLLEDHEEPHIEFNKPPAVPSIVVPPPPAPQRAAPSPQQNLPGAPRPSEAFGGGGMPEKPVISDKVQGTSSPAKPYSVDPYREPIDEK